MVTTLSHPKSFVVMDEKFVSEAENVFGVSDINVLHSRRLLGGVLGNEAGRNSSIEELQGTAMEV